VYGLLYTLSYVRRLSLSSFVECQRKRLGEKLKKTNEYIKNIVHGVYPVILTIRLNQRTKTPLVDRSRLRPINE